MNIIKRLKENNQDFEFYPTTNEILKDLLSDMEIYENNHIDFLDVGCGNGKVFNYINSNIPENSSISCYGIEKSKILIDSLPENIFILGTDFNKQTFIDKKMDVIFCNPPYKEFQLWMMKLISESFCKQLYLVIPERWKNNKEFLSMAEQRQFNYKIIGSYDFLESEDRKARARVDLVVFRQKSGYRVDDPFENWFNTNFEIKAKKSEYGFTSEHDMKEKINNKLVKGQSLVNRLEEMYKEEQGKLLSTYKSLENIDYAILKELDVNIPAVKEALKNKISGLKNVYWSLLFDNLTAITDRLTKYSRETILKKLMSHTSVDFSAENSYPIILWAIKNSNNYFDSQLLDVYMRISDVKNIINYKSNKRIIDDTWRYARTDHTHYKLDYRIIVSPVSNNFKSDGFYHNYINNLNCISHSMLDDICIIGMNLGFNIIDNASSFEWEPSKTCEFRYTENNKEKTFMAVKAYRNGNLHIKFNIDFMRKFNIEASRLNKWVKSPKEAADEMDIDIKHVNEFYNSNIKLESKNVKLLT